MVLLPSSNAWFVMKLWKFTNANWAEVMLTSLLET
jgi:hypothetical protein